MKWYTKVFVVTFGVLLGLGLALMIGPAPKPQQRPDQINLHFNSVVPHVLGASATTLCQNIHFVDKLADLHPYTNFQDRDLVAHEFIHVDQCERVGKITFYYAIHMKLLVGFLRYWNATKAYLNNDFEKEAYGSQGYAMAPWKIVVMERYWGPAPVGFR